jgi:hypothetical protein
MSQAFDDALAKLAALGSLALASFALGSCADVEQGGAAPPAPSASAGEERAATDAWLGRWQGPEGTYLDVEGADGRYEITIADLDGPRRFEGVAEGSGIAFERDGKREVIHATDGAGTGMKWLADEAKCLVVHPGEGYCRR